MSFYFIYGMDVYNEGSMYTDKLFFAETMCTAFVGGDLQCDGMVAGIQIGMLRAGLGACMTIAKIPVPATDGGSRRYTFIGELHLERKTTY